MSRNSVNNNRDDIQTNLKKHFYSIAIEQLKILGGKMPDGLSFATLFKEAEVRNNLSKFSFLTSLP